MRDVLTENVHRLKFVNAGVRCFTKTDIKHCLHPYRIAQDGIDILTKYVPEESERYLDVSRKDLVLLLSAEHPDYYGFSKELQEKNDKLFGQVFGSILIRMIEKVKIGEYECELVLTGWRGKQSVRVFVNKFERRHFLHLLGAPVPEAIDLKHSRIREKNRPEDAEKKEGEQNGKEEEEKRLSNQGEMKTEN